MLNSINRVGKPLGDHELSMAENALGYTLPIQYKDFLFLHNGGSPLESCIDFDGQKLNVSCDDIKRFYGVGGKPTNDLIHKMETIGDDLPEGVIYIANTHGGNFYLLSLRKDSYGAVFYKDHEYEDHLPFEPQNGVLPESIVQVADDLNDFISRLYDPEE